MTESLVWTDDETDFTWQCGVCGNRFAGTYTQSKCGCDFPHKLRECCHVNDSEVARVRVAHRSRSERIVAPLKRVAAVV